MNIKSSQLIILKKKIEGRLHQGFYSSVTGYGLRRDLSDEIKTPQVGIPIAVRPLAEGDIDLILPLHGERSADEDREITWRRRFHRKVGKGGYVAVDLRTGRPCFIQWLLGPEDNGLLARFKFFPKLKHGEALIEQSYTIPSHRRLGIMASASAMISKQAAKYGARYVYAFVGESGEISQRGLRRAGFYHYLLHRRIQAGYGMLVYNSFEVICGDGQSAGNCKVCGFPAVQTSCPVQFKNICKYRACLS